ncbi:MAG: AMP-binding protein [Phycisphaeraceae bacterium]
MAKPETLQPLIDQVARRGETPALLVLTKDGVERWSCAELADRVNRLAAGLADRGIEPGSRVGLLAENGPAWISLCLACLRAGLVPVPMDVQYPRDALAHVLGDADLALLCTTRGKLADVRRLDLDRQPGAVLLDAAEDDEQSWQRLLAEDGDRDFPAADADDTAVLFYTSGTTGPPKGVPLTHGNLSCQVHELHEAKLIGEADRLLLPLPLHHVYPLVLGMLVPLGEGTTIVLPASLTGPQITRAMREGNVTAVIGVPRLYRALVEGMQARVAAAGGQTAGRVFEAVVRGATWLRRRLGLRVGRLLLRPLHRRFGPDLRLLASGGSPLSEDLAWRLEGLGWRVATGYGLTETSPLLTWNLPGQAKLGSSGKPLPGVELKIDPGAAPEQGRQAADGQQLGEVLARGPGVFHGYRNLPDKTAEVLSEDGWYRTGDLGYVDEGGYLHVVGRVSTMIVTESGENVQPDDVEEAYARSPAIREIGVLQKGGRLVGLVVPEMREIRGHALDEIRDAVGEAVRSRREELPSYQRISEFAVTREPLPRTRLGKLRRHRLAERYEQARQGEEVGGGRAEPMAIEAMSGEDRQRLSNPAAQHVWDWLADRYRDEGLTPDTHLEIDLGIDSMDWLDLTLEIGQRAGVELDQEAIDRIETVRDLLGEVSEASRGAAAAPLERPDEVLDEAQKRALEPWGRGLAAVMHAAWQVERLLAKGIFRLRVEGREHLPAEGPIVLASNHLSYLDPPMLAAALGFERFGRTWWGGWTGYVQANPLTRMVSRLLHTAPVGGRQAISGFAFAAAVLERKRILAWFPEGQRSETGELQPFKPGLGRLLDARPATVVPAHVSGTYHAMPPGRRLPRPARVRVRFGEPVESRRLVEEGEGDEPADRIADALRKRIERLGAG